ncbi:hypothetical protein D3C80_572080 [compost metagenome]
MGIKDVAQSSGGFADGLVHGDPHRVSITLLTQVGVFHPARLGDGLAAGVAFGAEPTEVGRVGFVAGDLDHQVVFDLHDDAATHATIGTDTAYGFVCHPRPSNICQHLTNPKTKKAPCNPPLKRGLHGAFVVSVQSALTAWFVSLQVTRQKVFASSYLFCAICLAVSRKKTFPRAGPRRTTVTVERGQSSDEGMCSHQGSSERLVMLVASIGRRSQNRLRVDR